MGWLQLWGLGVETAMPQDHNLVKLDFNTFSAYIEMQRLNLPLTWYLKFNILFLRDDAYFW